MCLTLHFLELTKQKFQNRNFLLWRLYRGSFEYSPLIETHRLDRLKVRIKCIHTYRVSIISNLRRIKGENETFNVTLAPAKRFHLMANHSIGRCQNEQH